jgi:hypothetical protein
VTKVAELATGQLKGRDAVTVELVDADETSAVVITRWPRKPTRAPPHRFPRC